jgi:hypothetical protein
MRCFALKTPEAGLHQSFEGAAEGALNESLAGFTRTYRKVGSEYRLVSYSAPNVITIGLNDKGNISRVESIGGRWLIRGAKVWGFIPA